MGAERRSRVCRGGGLRKGCASGQALGVARLTALPSARCGGAQAGLFALLALSCSAGPEAADGGELDAGLGRDAQVQLDADVLDAGDGGLPDAGGLVEDASAPLEGVIEVRSEEGEVTRGEVVAVYDPSLWWHPSSGLRVALADPLRFAPGLQDDSVKVVSTDDLIEVRSYVWPQPRPSAREHQRQVGLRLGRVPLDGPAYVITAHEGYHLEEDGYGDFAWDLTRTDLQGRRYTSLGAENEDYLVWDAQVFLPTAGQVVEVVRDAPDNLPGDAPPGAINNLVGVNIGGRSSLYLLHFRQGTIPAEIVVGAQLEAGTYLGRVGNSGVSLEPHLHVTLLYWYEPPTGPARYYSLPSEFGPVQVAEAPDGPAGTYEFFDPPSGVWISNPPP